jgi:hypothetical protein
MKRLAGRLLDRPYKRVLFVLIAGLVGCGLGFLLTAEGGLKAGPWQRLPQPPVKLTQFASDTPMSYIDGVVANTADGTLYALLHQGGEWAWSRQEALPIPPGESWDARCPEGLEQPDGSVPLPRAPGPVVDTYAVRYCWGVGNANDFYVLLEDGSVWSTGYGEGGMGASFGSLLTVVCPACFGVGGLILGSVVVLVATKVAARRSRSAE